MSGVALAALTIHSPPLAPSGASSDLVAHTGGGRGAPHDPTFADRQAARAIPLMTSRAKMPRPRVRPMTEASVDMSLRTINTPYGTTRLWVTMTTECGSLCYAQSSGW